MTSWGGRSRAGSLQVAVLNERASRANGRIPCQSFSLVILSEVSIANESKDLGQLRVSEAGSDSAIAQRSLKHIAARTSQTVHWIAGASVRKLVKSNRFM